MNSMNKIGMSKIQSCRHDRSMINDIFVPKRNTVMIIK